MQSIALWVLTDVFFLPFFVEIYICFDNDQIEMKAVLKVMLTFPRRIESIDFVFI